jgi:hypothetical protein
MFYMKSYKNMQCKCFYYYIELNSNELRVCWLYEEELSFSSFKIKKCKQISWRGFDYRQCQIKYLDACNEW